MSQLANQLVTAEKEEVAHGIRQLLATPLITERSLPESFDLVRRRREPITQWFDYYCGWTLTARRPSIAGATCCSASSRPNCSPCR